MLLAGIDFVLITANIPATALKHEVLRVMTQFIVHQYLMLSCCSGAVA